MSNQTMSGAVGEDISGWVERAMELADDMTSAAFHSARCACAADPIVRAASDRWADDRDTYQKQLRAHLTAQSALAEQLVEALRFYGSSCDATESTPCGYEGNLCCKVARAALAAAKEQQ